MIRDGLKFFGINLGLMTLPLILSCSKVIPPQSSTKRNAACKIDSANCPSLESIIPLTAAPGETVKLVGKNLQLLNRFWVNETEVTPSALGDAELTFIMPPGKRGFVTILDAQNIPLLSPIQAYRLDAKDYPIVTLDPDQVCSGIDFYNINREIKTGSKDCSNQSLGGTSVNDCLSEGQTNCKTTTLFPAIQADLIASKCLATTTVAGINGLIALPAIEKVLSGHGFGAGGAALQGTLTLPLAVNVKQGSPAYGETGSLRLPSFAPDFPLASNVRASDTVNGSPGTLADCTAANQSGCVATTTYKTMNLSAMNTDTGLTAANFQSRIATAANSEFWDALGARHSVAGDSDLSVGNIKAGVTIQGSTGQYPSASFRLATNTVTTDFTNFATQFMTDGTFEFFDSTGTRYTGSGDSDLLTTNIKNSVTFENLSVTGTFRYNCPTNWIKVPGDSAYGTNDFCVMKYEAKDVGGIATSQAASVPWGSINHTSAIATCRALGTGYDLINNAEWMTIASNLAAIGSNWTSATVGTGTLFAGHTDSSPGALCAAASDASGLFFVETTCTAIASGDTAEQKRVFTLSNGEVIWDLSGNSYEWVNLINRADKPGATNAFYEYTTITATTTTALKDLYPTMAVKAFWNDSWNSSQLIGKYYPGTNGAGGALLRGGGVFHAVESGVFRADFDDDPTFTDLHIGFRCAFRPPNP